MSLANWTTRLLVGAKNGDVPTQAPGGAATAGGGGSSLVGTRIGAYQITKRLGAGGVGEVLKGVDTMLNRDVAIKVLRDELAADPVFLARFRNEAQLHAKLNHPNVASVHAFVQEGDKQFLVMEYVAGVSLDEFIRAGGPVPLERALAIFRRALDGIEHAHTHGIVHRDIKPANIMLADNGQVKVMDFGIARALDSQEHLTRIGHVAGTAKAMSPEQIRGKQADVRSDIYSLGIVLYTLLAGRAPFDSANDVELMKAQLEQAPPPLRGLVEALPAKVEAAVMKALEKDPAARYQSVREFARVIDACMPVQAPLPARDMKPGPDAPTTSRTAINPALQGVRQLPAAGPSHSRPAGLPRWARFGAISLAVVALGGGAALVWTMLGTPADNTTRAGTPPEQRAQAPVSPPTPAPQVPPAPVQATPPQAPEAAATPEPPAPAPAIAIAPPSPPPVVELPKLPTLSILRLALGGRAGADVNAGAAAGHAYRPGERIELLVKPSDDLHVYCYLQDETRRILRFYPNRFQPSSFVRAAAPLAIPGKMRFELVANSLKASETVACFASERDLSAELPASVLGDDFAKLPVTSLDDVREAFARVSGGASTEARFQIDVR